MIIMILEALLLISSVVIFGLVIHYLIEKYQETDDTHLLFNDDHSSYYRHIVKSGDTIESIAKKYYKWPMNHHGEVLIMLANDKYMQSHARAHIINQAGFNKHLLSGMVLHIPKNNTKPQKENRMFGIRENMDREMNELMHRPPVPLSSMFKTPTPIKKERTFHGFGSYEDKVKKLKEGFKS